MSRLTFSGELKFNVNQHIEIGFRGNVYSYSLTAEKEAWHLPSYDAALFSTVRLADRIYIRGGYFATSARNARDLNSKEFVLAAINDVNLGFEYRYKKNISGFIRVNNILNQRYELWNNYRAQGLNALAGITFSL
jgi:outer membrane receptor protein involved in Fe transport